MWCELLGWVWWLGATHSILWHLLPNGWEAGRGCQTSSKFVCQTRRQEQCSLCKDLSASSLGWVLCAKLPAHVAPRKLFYASCSAQVPVHCANFSAPKALHKLLYASYPARATFCKLICTNCSVQVAPAQMALREFLRENYVFELMRAGCSTAPLLKTRIFAAVVSGAKQNQIGTCRLP